MATTEELILERLGDVKKACDQTGEHVISLGQRVASLEATVTAHRLEFVDARKKIEETATGVGRLKTDQAVTKTRMVLFGLGGGAGGSGLLAALKALFGANGPG